MLSAAIHLSLSDSKKALQKLLLSNNLEYAYILASTFCPEALDHLSSLLSAKALEAAANDLAHGIASKIKDESLRSLMLASIQQQMQGQEGSGGPGGMQGTAATGVTQLLARGN